MVPIQLDLFREDDESERLALMEEVKKLKTTLDKVRKGTYARLNEHGRVIVEMASDLEILKRNICRGEPWAQTI